MTKTSALALLAVTALAGTSGAVAAGASGPAAQPAAKPSKAVSAKQVAKVRAATARFRDVKKALAAGYIAAPECAEDAKRGAMGFHYIHPELVGDRKVDITKPEFLLYVPKPGGGVRLAAVEYYVADSDNDVRTRDTDLPRPLGHELDGPMEGHAPGMPAHNDLHVWVWEKNPKGLFSQYNPRLSC